MGPFGRTSKGTLATAESLTALLALAGSRRVEVDELQARMKLTAEGCEELISWLQREYLVDVVSSLDGRKVRDVVQLTDKGEQVLISLLERTCELPELR
jgi:CTP-dependent riboflavin kinase